MVDTINQLRKWREKKNVESIGKPKVWFWFFCIFHHNFLFTFFKSFLNEEKSMKYLCCHIDAANRNGFADETAWPFIEAANIRII